jgi:hypothetical protein
MIGETAMPLKPWDPSKTPDWFWEILDQAQGDREKLKPLLMSLARARLVDFKVLYQRLMTAVRGTPYMGPNLSEDDQDDFARWVVAKGRDYYFDVLKNPTKMPPKQPDKTGNGFISTVLRTFYERFGEELSL